MRCWHQGWSCGGEVLVSVFGRKFSTFSFFFLRGEEEGWYNSVK